MSPSIWTRCGARTSFRTLEGTPWRIVESQQRISTRQLVDSDAEHALLEDLIEGGKPALPPGPEFRGLHFLLFSPFRYPPLPHGSRFGGRHERALWYGSDDVETALAEASYYRLLLFEGTEARLAPNRVPKSGFQAAVRSLAAVDLSRAPFDAHRAAISSRTDYAESQRLGTELREAGGELIRYASARDPRQGTNVAVVSPTAFALKKPLGPGVTWHCTVAVDGGVSWMREDVSGLVGYEFSRGDFLVNGKLPAPAF